MFFFKIAKVENPFIWPASDLADDMRELTDSLRNLGEQIEVQLDRLSVSLRTGRLDHMQALAARDEGVNRLRANVERQSIEIAARPHLPIGNLRHAMSALRVSAELEQVAHLARSIERSLLQIKPAIPDHLSNRLAGMIDLIRQQFQDVRAGYALNDSAVAFDVWRRDEEVDRLHNSLFSEILSAISGNTRNISFGAQLLFCIKDLERVGDHATNIAEFVFYAICGQRIASDRPKCDTTKFPSRDF